jgi:hypothetical protein
MGFARRTEASRLLRAGRVTPVRYVKNQFRILWRNLLKEVSNFYDGQRLGRIILNKKFHTKIVSGGLN